jgi:plastocyanin
MLTQPTSRIALALALLAGMSQAQDHIAGSSVELHLHSTSLKSERHPQTPAVAWLVPLGETPTPPFQPRGHYTLLQKNRTFVPHLLVIPVGSVVQFPNADPFFHNVFSLFDGKRFDLGLYEAGSSKSITFSREGVSYIFCNIHPEMSAVVLTLATPFYAVADKNDAFTLRNIPSGDYQLHIWVEGVPQPTLESFSRKVHVARANTDLGELPIPIGKTQTATHENKFGRPYDQTPTSTY